MRESHPEVPTAARIESVTQMTAETALYRLRLDEPLRPCASFIPGRFVQLSVPAGGEVPISVAAPPDGRMLELCIRTVGRATSMLAAAGPGATVGVRGYFGNGFPVEEMRGGTILLLAGGIGMAPLRSLLLHLLTNRGDYGGIFLLYGARASGDYLFRDEIARLAKSGDVRISLCAEREPGSGETLSCTVGLLPDLIGRIDFVPGKTWAAACGPPAMYGPLVGRLTAAGLPPERILLSLERRMKCGVGLCCHCAVGELLCCTDGPVFPYSRISGIEGAL